MSLLDALTPSSDGVVDAALALFDPSADVAEHDPVAVAATVCRWDPGAVWELVARRCAEVVDGVEVAALLLLPASPLSALLAAVEVPDVPEAVTYALAARPDLDPERVRAFAAQECNLWGRSPASAALSNPSCPPDVLVAASREGLGARRAVAANPSCPASILEELTADLYEDVRSVAAQNPRTPETCLRRLFADHDGWVTSRVVANPSCPPDLIEAAARSKNPAAVAEARLRLAAAVSS